MNFKRLWAIFIARNREFFRDRATFGGLLVASRGTSEEFTSGILNFITWPMMFLSEVWFSIEGSPQWIKMIAQVFPLTHMLTGVRKIMNDGAGLPDVGLELSILLLITSICLGLGARLFSWNN